MAPPANLSVGAAAARLAAVDHAYSPDYLARQLRSFIQRGYLKPAAFRGEGRTAAALLDRSGLAFARLLTVLARFGLTPEQMQAAADGFANVDNLPVRRRVEPVEWLLDEVAAGRLWFYELRLAAGGGRILGGFVKQSELSPFETEALGAILLPVNGLLKGVLEPAKASAAGR